MILKCVTNILWKHDLLGFEFLGILLNCLSSLLSYAGLAFTGKMSFMESFKFTRFFFS